MITAKTEIARIQKSFVKQKSPAHCGLACLVSIVKYYGGNASQEMLQDKLKGPSLYELLELSQTLGFIAKGFKADVENLEQLEEPVILHVLNEQKQGHYIVCYRYAAERFLLGDPSWGIIEYRKEELEAIWQSKVLLTLKPNDGFLIDTTRKKKKYNPLELFTRWKIKTNL